MNTLKTFFKYLVLFLIGGLTYYLIELLYRQYSHVSMIAVGGGCFIAIGMINEFIPWSMKLWKQMLIGSIYVTFIEFISGVVINIILGWNVWDYSMQPYNILGQVCLLFTAYWFFLSLPAIILDDYLRYWLFKEEKPHYEIV